MPHISQWLLFAAGAASASGLVIAPSSRLGRRAALAGCSSGLVLPLLPALPAFAAKEPKEAVTVKETAAALKDVLEKKDAFITGLADGDEKVKLPAPIPFTSFQKLEKTSDPEFMEAAIDYAEAFRGAKDLVKLAKLTKEPVTISTKEKGKPRQDTTMTYGEAPGSNLASAKEYAERAIAEVLGASLALDAALSYMKYD